jgi:hypothetical protein
MSAMIKTLGDLRALFPREGKNCAATGRIPMDYFEANEAAIREIRRSHGLRLFYRGPRRSNQGRSRSVTRRCDATHVMLW